MVQILPGGSPVDAFQGKPRPRDRLIEQNVTMSNGQVPVNAEDFQGLRARRSADGQAVEAHSDALTQTEGAGR
jgi:hypothetical protein